MDTGYFISIGLGAVFSGFAFLAGVGGSDIASDVLAPSKPYGLHLEELYFLENGKIKQNMQPVNAPAVKGKWAAKFSRGSKHLCGSGNTATYDGQIYIFTPSEWTGDNCPELQDGDVGSAIWTYNDVNGDPVAITKKIIYKRTPVK